MSSKKFYSDSRMNETFFAALPGATEKGSVFSCNEVTPDTRVFPQIYFELRNKVAELQLGAFGLAPVGDAHSYPIFLSRVRKGYCANLPYLTDDPDKRRSPRSVLPDAQTLIIVALTERQLQNESREATEALINSPELSVNTDDPRYGTTLNYATCLDYHNVLRKKLKSLEAFFKAFFPNASTRVAVDTAPLLEKDWAQAAGLGFIGLNSLLIAPGLGSRIFLGELLVSESFDKLTGFSTSEEYLKFRTVQNVQDNTPSFNTEKARKACLTCQRCLKACPTNAIVGDRTLDARRCLNFWTIENRNEIPPDIAEKLDGRLFGCDLCQRLCPWNASLEQTSPHEIPLDAVERLDDATFRRLFKKTPIFRATLDGLKRVSRALKQDAPPNKKSPTTD